jgi:serralysin
MSYFGAGNTGANYDDAGAKGTLMLHDVLALQRLYGANTNAFNGNTIYGFNSNTNRDAWNLTGTDDNIYGAIWDTGGIDTIDSSGYSTDGFIFLRESQ